MKKIRIFILLLAAVWAGTASPLRAEEGVSVFSGKAGKMLIFTHAQGMKDIAISLNNKYYIMRGEAFSFVYNIATGQLIPFEEDVVVDYKDDENFVTNHYAYINGKKYSNWLGLASGYMVAPPDFPFQVVGTDTSMRYVRCHTYDNQGGNGHITVIIDILGNGGDGQVLYQLPHYDPMAVESPSFGSFAWCNSNDMKVFAGHSSIGQCVSSQSPAFWDCNGEEPVVFYPGEVGEYVDGRLLAVNNDGSVIVGGVGNGSYVIFYDKASRTYTKQLIPTEPGRESVTAYGVSENGKVIGWDQPSSENLERRGMIYDYKADKRFYLEEYLLHLYGINALEKVEDLFTSYAIDDDARLIGGYTGIGGDWYPYLFVLDEHQVHAAPRSLSVRQPVGKMQAVVAWKAPLVDEYPLKGFNVYRNDSVKANTELLSADATMFTDQGLVSGMYKYCVEAVYEDDSTVRSAETGIQIVGAGDCLPVQEIVSDILYNKTVTVRWGLPSAQWRDETGTETEAKAGTADGETSPKGYLPEENELDLIKLQNSLTNNASSMVRIGDYYYAGTLNTAVISVYNAYTGELEKTVTVEGLTCVYDMTVEKNTIYLVSRDKTVFQLTVDEDDPFEISLADQWNSRYEEAVNIAYVKGGENEEDYLLVGDWDGVTAYSLHPRNANDTLSKGFHFDFGGKANSFSGSEVHKGVLYLAAQESVAGNRDETATVYAYSMETGARISATNLYDYPQLISATGHGGYVAGLTKEVMEDGTVALIALVDPDNGYSQYAFLEAETAPQVRGYNLYRNGVKLNSDYLKCRHYTEEIDEAGEYEYVVEYVSEDCSSKSSDAGVSCKVRIADRGECFKPAKLSVHESDNMAVLTWDMPQAGSSGYLVGFNIYRNETMLTQYLLDLKYRDERIEKGEKYIYRVEAYYDNSCTADTLVEIVPTFEGTAEAPTLVKGSVKKENGKPAVELTWDLPYFEQPMALGYCNIPYRGIGLDDEEITSTYVAIGWDANDMKNFTDLYLVGMEFYIATDKMDATHGLVYIDDVKVYDKATDNRIRPNAWNTLYFDEVFSMQQEHEIAVGYAVFYDPEIVTDGTMVYDFGPGRTQYSDLVSADGITYTTLYAASNGQLDVNLCINALVVRKRDIEAAKRSGDYEGYIRKKAVSLNKLSLSEPTALAADAPAPKSTSESFTLKGFNVYREGEKLNDELLTGFSFTDPDVEMGEEYEYVVSAGYAQGIEKKSDPIYVEIVEVGLEEGNALKQAVKLVNNPVVAGQPFALNLPEVCRVEIFNANGVLVRTENKVDGMRFYTLPSSGLYLIRVTAAAGDSKNAARTTLRLIVK